MPRLVFISILVCLSFSLPLLGQSKTKSNSKIAFVNCGICNSKAIFLPKPPYPAQGTLRASGSLRVSIKVDERGNVYWAEAISGHVLLRSSSEQVARKARFRPFRLRGKIVRAFGTLVYNFPPADTCCANVPQIDTRTCLDCYTGAGKEIFLAQPKYPAAARKIGLEESVQLLIRISPNGNVVSAEPISGNKIFWPNAVRAARISKFKKPLFLGKPVTIVTTITYNFLLSR